MRLRGELPTLGGKYRFSWWQVADVLPLVVFLALKGGAGPGGSWAVAVGVSCVLFVAHRRGGRSSRLLLGTLATVSFLAGMLAIFGTFRYLYLPGMVLASLFTVALLISPLLKRPALGYVAARFDPQYKSWRDSPRAIRLLSVLTLVWALAIGLRTAGEWWLYLSREDDALVVFRYATRPLHTALFFGTLVALRRGRRFCSPQFVGPEIA